MKREPLLTHLAIKKLKMPLLIICLTFGLLLFHTGNAFAAELNTNNKQIHLPSSQMTIGEIIEEIETQTDYLVVFSNSEVDVNHEIRVRNRNTPIKDCLENVFVKNDIRYEIENNYIILSKNTIKQTTQQTTRITGTITDLAGEPIIGANIVVKGTINGVISDFDGNFVINATSASVLQISYIGYIPQEITVGNNTVLLIRLEEDSQTLSEVVVVGFGTQKRLNLTGAVATVTGDEIAKRPVANTSTMLQGLVPGLRVTSNTGQPGNEAAQFRIRGQGTYSTAGSDPLILINGVEGDLSTLDPNIIENVSVLKDAASASIYGSRAANGVILVTTKSGVGKDRVNISYRGNYAIHKATNLLDLVWDSPTYMKYFNMAKTNSGASTSDMYTDEMIRAYTNPTDPVQYPSFNWIDYMFSNSFVHQHNINASGSTGKTSYNVSLSMIDQPGTMKGFEYKRYNVAVDLTSQLNDWIRIGAYFSASRSDRQATRQGDTDAYLSTISQAPTYMPWLPDDGTGVRRWTFKAYPFESNNKNMVAIIEEGNFIKRRFTDTNTQLWLEVNPVKGLTWYTKGAARFNLLHEKNWGSLQPTQYYYQSGEYGRDLNNNGTGLTSTMNTNTYLNLYSYLKYDWNTPNKAHAFSAMAGYSVESHRLDNLEGKRTEYDFALQELNAGGTDGMTNSGKSEEWGLVSGFFRLNYNFKERYLFEANARYDGSSRIAEESRWGLFPSFSVGWRITEEKWMKGVTWLNNAKIRGSYGILGNQTIDLYSYYPTLTTTVYSFDNNSLSNAVRQRVVSNNKLKWETTAITDIGVDLTLFRGLNITFDWYNKKVYDILRQAQASNLLGMDKAPFINDGEMVNKGIELSVQYANTIRSGAMKGFNYNVGFFVDRTRNKLTKFGEDEINSGLLKREGLPYESFYTYKAIGIFKDWNDIKNSPQFVGDTNVQPGDIKYEDTNGDGKVDSDDQVVIKGRFPNFEYSVNLSASWKGFDISLMGQGVQGAKHYATGWGLRPYNQGTPPTYDYLENMWTEENPNGKYPRLYFDDMGGSKNNRPSSYWLHDASYFRLKNLTFGYSLPKEWISKARINMLRVYFSGDNILTITKFPQGGDPERNYTSTTSTRLVYYPQNKIFSFGVNIEF